MELFRALFEGAPDASVVTDRRGEILLVNSQTEMLFGYSRDELLGKPVEILVPESLRDVHEMHRAHYFADPSPRPMGAKLDLSGRRRDGTEFPVEISLSPLQTKQGLMVSASIRDVTARRLDDKRRRHEHETMQLIMNSIDEGIIVADRRGRLVLMNKAAERICGRTSLDVPKDRWSEYFNLYLPDGLTPFPNDELPILRALKGETIDDVEVVIRSPLPSNFTLLHVAARPLLEEGEIQGGMVVFRDVTERARIDAALRESEARFREAFDHAPIGMYLTRLDGAWLRVNDAFCQIVGLTKEELLSTSWKDLTHPDDLKPDLENVRKLLAREIPYYHMEKRYFHRDGHIVWILLHGSLVCDKSSQPSHFVGHVVDISARKHADEAVRRYAEALARSNADLRQFASAASHDLQAPLRSVAGFCELLESRYADAFDEDGKKWLRLLVQDARNMQALVRGLLRFSRVESEGRPLLLTDSGEALERALSHLRADIEQSRAEITLGPMPSVVADADQLVDVFQNLIGNAIKYRGRAAPRIRVTAAETEGTCQFSIRDNGIGIDARFHERVFAMFQRLHLQEDYPGTGIGLTLCKRIVERHGGRIWVKSVPDEGSEFLFTIPSERRHE